MVQPYNYAIQAPSAFESLVSGLKLGTSLQEMQAQREQRALQAQAMQQKMEAERQRQEVLRDFYGKAKAEQPLTVADWLRFGEASGSEQYRNLASAQIQAMPEAQQQANAGFMGQTMVALYKSPEIGLKLLRDRVAANPQDKGLQAILQTAETNTKAAAVGMYGMMSGLGGKFADVAKNVADTLGMKEEAPLSPEAKRKAVADAIQAEADARIKLTNAKTQGELNQAELELKRAQAAKAKAESEGRGTPLVNVMPQYGAPPAGMQNIFDEQGRLVAQRPIPESEKDIAFQRQRAAIETLRSVGYDPETGEDDISKAIASSTSGGAQADIAAVMRYFGGTSKGMQAINKLKGAASRITLEILGGNLGAGISNPDREFITQGLGDIGNEKLTASERLAGWTSAKNRMVQIGILPAGRQTQLQQPTTPQSGVKPVTEMSNEEILRRLRGQ
jgi:hypothetical protein